MADFTPNSCIELLFWFMTRIMFCLLLSGVYPSKHYFQCLTLCCWGAALNAGREWGQVSWHKLAKGMLPTREGHAQCVNWRSYLGGVWLLFGDMLRGQQLYHASLFSLVFVTLSTPTDHYYCCCYYYYYTIFFCHEILIPSVRFIFSFQCVS